MFRSAPPLEMPAPSKVSASAPMEMLFVNSKAAPFWTVMPPETAPAPVAFASRTAPSFTRRAPVKLPADGSVSLPAPTLTTPPAPSTPFVGPNVVSPAPPNVTSSPTAVTTRVSVSTPPESLAMLAPRVPMVIGPA